MLNKLKKWFAHCYFLSGFSENNNLRKYGDINFWVDSNSYNIIEMTHHIWLVAVVDYITQEYNNEKNKVLVTGGAGFIGSHLVDLLLKNNYDVIILDNFSTGRLENIQHVKNQIKIVECDISEDGQWTKNFADCFGVFHLAALADIVPSITNPDDYFKSNVLGTYNVLNASRNNKIKRFIYSASSSCYGIPTKYPTKEISDIKPEYPYALTKMGEDLVLHWEKVYKIPSISLRFFNVYGTRSRTSGTYGACFWCLLSTKN